MKTFKGTVLSLKLHEISIVCDPQTKESITIGELLKLFSNQGHFILCCIFSAPFLLPIPLPGLSVILGLLIFFLGLGIVFNFPPYIPKKFSTISLESKFLAKLFHFLAMLSQKLEFVIRPRFSKIVIFSPMKKISGFIICLSGLFLALPLPPGTNFPPSLVIIIISLAHVECDGILLIVGHTFFITSSFYLFKILNLFLEKFLH